MLSHGRVQEFVADGTGSLREISILSPPLGGAKSLLDTLNLDRCLEFTLQQSVQRSS